MSPSSDVNSSAHRVGLASSISITEGPVRNAESRPHSDLLSQKPWVEPGSLRSESPLGGDDEHSSVRTPVAGDAAPCWRWGQDAEGAGGRGL